MANCYSGDTCEELVNVQYMRELASEHCVTVSSATPFESECCPADESEFCPTYSAITASTYAPYRKLENEPTNDTNGFSAYTQESDDINIPKSALTFGYTVITSVTLSSGATNLGTCNPGWIVYKKNNCARFLYECDKEVTSASVSSSEDEQVSSGNFNKEYGDIEYYESSGRATCNVSYAQVVVSASTIDKCGNVETAATTVGIDENYVVSIYFSGCDNPIPCDGDTVSAITSGNVCNDLTITGYSVSTTENVESGGTISGNGVFTMKFERNNNGYTSTTIQVGFKIGENKDGVITCGLTRQTCQISPIPPDAMTCGLFPGNDDWSNHENEVVVHNYEENN